ncbi:MAG: efflux RND transporter periplasmic adaptor subunit [Legionellales bacterium]|nr:efflux RND transporter periplasmic adaptor subunit [Legionellales bacterium]
MKKLYQPCLFYLKKYKKTAIAITCLALSVLMFNPYLSTTRPAQISLVNAVQVVERPTPLVMKAMGTVESQQSAVITPQVTGKITQINFRPGQRVQKGQALFTIEANTFNAVLEQAQATLQRDQAQLVYLNATEKRYASLVKLEYVTRDQYEQAVASANAQAALVKADQALVEQAKIQLGYTVIRAPVSGKLGNYTVRVGDLVVANSVPLLTINQISSAWIDFNVPQRDLQNIRYFQHQKRLQVDILSEDGTEKLGEGVLSFIDNLVDPKTGTVLLKAETDNNGDILWPGEMVKVVITLTIEQHALVIPLSAVQFDNQGSFVYLLQNNIAVVHRIKIARQTTDFAVIQEGLQKGDFVLTTIPPDLVDGATVKVVSNND